MGKQPSTTGLPPLIRALRPSQWIKNGLVFAAPLFAYTLYPAAIVNAALTFVAFCLVSSGTYLVNDLFDLEQDRLHPEKCKRPLASGELSVGAGRIAAVVCLLGGLGLAWFVDYRVVTVLAVYLGVQAVYNLAFKHILILDIMTLASGFVLRAVAGGVAAFVPLSPWFLFCVALLAFYIGLEKRKSELRRMQSSGVTTRKILREYSLEFLTQIETATLACILMGYALWTIQGTESSLMMLTVPFVLYGILRYQYLSGEELVERPEEALFKDRPIFVNVVLWILSCTLILAYEHLGGA